MGQSPSHVTENLPKPAKDLVACPTCRGDNPHFRLMQGQRDRQCEVCATPFVVFRWRAGRSAFYTETLVCEPCAKRHNFCQVCREHLQHDDADAEVWP